jgi:hypothetical protein
MQFQIGSTVAFRYNGKNRLVRVEYVKHGKETIFGNVVTTHMTGWDALADGPTGGYRTFRTRCIDPNSLRVLNVGV